MLVTHETNEVTLNNVTSVGEFKIRNSARAFSILSSGLYSNKIRAIVRELSCNAVDSHVAAKKTDVPFEVHLPSTFEPWFSVRDFGVGLSGDQVTNIYTTYFESTKTDSNDYIGALGLGSKSPFSYTDNFTVTAIKDGYRRIYSAYINEVGVPCVAEMSEELTDEINGVEVKFSVNDRYDYNSFRREAQNVFRWFKNKPNVIGCSDFVFDVIKYKEENIVPGVHLNIDESRYSFAVMGNIAYPLDKLSEPEKHFGDLSALLGCGLILEFNIGELDFAASREELSYVPITLNSIKKKLELLNTNLAGHIAKKADAIANEWERAEFLYTSVRSRLYKPAVLKYVADAKFELFESDSWTGHKTFNLSVENLTTRGLSIDGFRAEYHRSSRLKEYITYNNGKQERKFRVAVDTSAVFVFNDLKTGCTARARHHFVTVNGLQKTVYCLSHVSPDLAIRQAAYNKLIAELHNPPTVINASDLEKRPTAQRTPTQGLTRLLLKVNADGRSPSDYKWVQYTDEIDEDTIYYYVCLDGHDSIRPDGTSFPLTNLAAKMRFCGLAAIENIKIMGVRKSRIKEITGLDNWVWIEDKIREEIAKVNDSDIVSLLATEMLDSYYNKVHTSIAIANLAGKDSLYNKYVTYYNNIPRVSGSVTELASLCTTYGTTLQVAAIKQKITDDKAELLAKYPLIPFLTSANEHHVAEYIRLIDNKE